MDGDLAGKVAIVTGAAGGIGRATALTFAREGASVVIADINEDGANETLKAVEGAASASLALKIDVSRVEDVDRMVQRTISKFGRVDVLVNNAAATSKVFLDGDSVTNAPEFWEDCYRTNFLSVVFGCKYAIPHMVNAGGGVIINISSTLALLGDVHHFAYATSKAAINLLTMSTATRWGKYGIRCNSICPGPILSPEQLAAVPEAQASILRDNCLTRKIGRPENIAEVITFLCSEKAEFVTGQILAVDGGMTAHQTYWASYNANPDIPRA